MKVLSLSKLAEEAAYLGTGERRFAGGVGDVKAFRENLAALDSAFHGVFCWIAFHPSTDSAVAAYLEAGTLAEDTGPNVLALFLAAAEIRLPRELTQTDLQLGVTIEGGTSAVAELVSWLFPGDSRPVLPGIVFFDRLAAEVVNAVHVPLTSLDRQGVTERCRLLFSLAERSLATSASVTRVDLDFDEFCRRLDAAGIGYDRVGPATLRRAGYSLWDWVKKHRGEIAAVLGKALQMRGGRG
ncbi:MAG TPA: hypothetical protein VMJ75_10310 [Candidatus Acidoferrales bacterium]|nr:hypothetical protein [Candidatus Acidoferrales bacterium]